MLSNVAIVYYTCQVHLTGLDCLSTGAKVLERLIRNDSALGGPVDVPFVILHRLEELGLEQQELARAAHVTESYISQLLTRRKAPPAPNRTDIYDRMDKFLKLPSGELAKLADLQRKEELKRELGDEPAPLFHEVRELILRHRPCDVRSGGCPKPQRRPRAGEAIRVCRAGSRTVCQRRARAQGIPSGFVSQRHGDPEGSRVSQAAEVPGPAADAPLLLPGVAEPQRSAPLSHAVGRSDPFDLEPALEEPGLNLSLALKLGHLHELTSKVASRELVHLVILHPVATRPHDLAGVRIEEGAIVWVSSKRMTPDDPRRVIRMPEEKPIGVSLQLQRLHAPHTGQRGLAAD